MAKFKGEASGGDSSIKAETTAALLNIKEELGSFNKEDDPERYKKLKSQEKNLLDLLKQTPNPNEILDEKGKHIGRINLS